MSPALLIRFTTTLSLLQVPAHPCDTVPHPSIPPCHSKPLAVNKSTSRFPWESRISWAVISSGWTWLWGRRPRGQGQDPGSPSLTLDSTELPWGEPPSPGALSWPCVPSIPWGTLSEPRPPSPIPGTLRGAQGGSGPFSPSAAPAQGPALPPPPAIIYPFPFAPPPWRDRGHTQPPLGTPGWGHKSPGLVALGDGP